MPDETSKEPATVQPNPPVDGGNGQDPAPPGDWNQFLRDDPDQDPDSSWVTPAPDGQPWPEIEAEAFDGVAGQVVDTLAPETEADPVALPMRLSFTKPSLIGPALSGSTVSTVNRGVWWSGAKPRAWCRSLNVSPIPMASQC
jgi:hypothetical protein